MSDEQQEIPADAEAAVDLMAEGEAVPTDANANGLAEIAAALAARGLAPEGDYDIALRVCEVIDQVAAERDALQAQLDKAAKAASVAASKASGGRKCGGKDVKTPLAPTSEGGRAVSVAEQLLCLIGDAETVEIAFSNGTKEVAGLDAVLVSGDAWRVTQAGLQLNLPELIVHGPAADRPPYALNGYGLFLDGKLAAYAPRSEQLNIAGGARVNLAQDVVFA